MIEEPKAPKREQELILHSDTRIDPWFWLRDVDDPETIPYLEAENAYLEATMKSTEGLQEDLYKEMRARIKEDDSSVPEKEGDYFYYTRYETDGQYAIYCRKRGSLDAAEEVLLDVNALAEGVAYMRIGVCRNSPDHRWLAYSTDEDGGEEYTLRVRNLETGEDLTEAFPKTYYSLAWANDSRTFFYTVLDENHRPVKVYRHRLGDDPAQDALVFEEKDVRFFVHVERSASRRFIYIAAGGNNMSEWRFLDADHPAGELRLIEPRRKDFEYDVVDHGDRFLIRNNDDGAKDFKVSEAPVDSSSAENWRDFVPHKPGRLIRGLVAFKDHLVIAERRNGLPEICVMDLAGGEAHRVAFDEAAYTVGPQGSREWDTTTLRFSYMSMTTPNTVYDYDMTTRDRLLRKQDEVLGGFDSAHYETQRIFATARDGARVPISLAYRKGTPLDGSAPLILYGYGSYGNSTEASFNSNRLSMVDRGFIFAVAHIRGGMEMGWDWYENGKLLKKKHTFTDFIDCAEHLIEMNYTRKGEIVAVGGSAGGLLMGAVVNMRPELFKAAIAHVPFVDVLSTMLDDTLPLTTMEYNEWGNPNDPAFYDYIKSYSPYDNVSAQAYPHLLITGGINDPRVTYWEPAKWTAKLRETRTDKHLLLMKIHMESGHAGASGRFDYLKEVALDWAFALKVFGKA